MVARLFGGVLARLVCLASEYSGRCSLKLLIPRSRGNRQLNVNHAAAAVDKLRASVHQDLIENLVVVPAHKVDPSSATVSSACNLNAKATQQARMTSAHLYRSFQQEGTRFLLPGGPKFSQTHRFHSCCSPATLLHRAGHVSDCIKRRYGDAGLSDLQSNCPSTGTCRRG